MKMPRSILTISVALLVAVTSAQQPNDSFDPTVIAQVASEIGASTASAWCSAQSRACTLLCNNQATTNVCRTTSLEYSCTCSDGSIPPFQYYTPTMISLICNKHLGDCLEENAGNPSQQANCKASIVCGNTSVSDYNGPSSGGSGSISLLTTDFGSSTTSTRTRTRTRNEESSSTTSETSSTTITTTTSSSASTSTTADDSTTSATSTIVSNASSGSNNTTSSSSALPTSTLPGGANILTGPSTGLVSSILLAVLGFLL